MTVGKLEKNWLDFTPSLGCGLSRGGGSRVMSAQDTAEAKFVTRRGGRLARAFWILGCVDLLVCLVWLMQVETSPGGEFTGYIVFLLYVLLGLVGVVIGIVALVRRPAAYAIGLALLIVPPIWWALMRLPDLIDAIADPGG